VIDPVTISRADADVVVGLLKGSTHADRHQLAQRIEAAVIKADLARRRKGAPASDEDLRRLWRDAGGAFHGPIIETGYMHEENLLPFLRKLLGERTSACSDAEIENAVRDALNARPMGTFGQIIDYAVNALALDHARLRHEIEVLRQYGNKDCTAMADAALAAEKAP
jgi:hypothetical protein